MDPPIHQFYYRNQLVRFAVWNPNDVVQREHVRGDFYEIDDLEYHRSLIPVGATVVDVGANVGNHSVYYACCTRAVRVVAIEACPECFTKLQRNIEINPLARKKCQTINSGVGEKTGRATLRPGPPDNSGLTQLTLEDSGPIEIVTLDSLIPEEREVTLLKIDVEGMESAVLRGATESLREHRPVLSIECRVGREAEITQLLDEHRYRRERTFWHHAGVRNLVFVPE
jgi:FkbM family methyltransferase